MHRSWCPPEKSYTFKGQKKTIKQLLEFCFQQYKPLSLQDLILPWYLFCTNSHSLYIQQEINSITPVCDEQFCSPSSITLFIFWINSDPGYFGWWDIGNLPSTEIHRNTTVSSQWDFSFSLDRWRNTSVVRETEVVSTSQLLTSNQAAVSQFPAWLPEKPAQCSCCSCCSMSKAKLVPYLHRGRWV